MLVRLHLHSVLALSLNGLMAAAPAPLRREGRYSLRGSSQKAAGFPALRIMCASQRTDPTQRTITQHLLTFRIVKHPPPDGARLDVQSAHKSCFSSQSEARSGRIKFFGFNLVACPSRVFPSHLFLFFVLLRLFCSIWYALRGATFTGCCCCCCLLVAPCWSLGVLRWCGCPLLVFLLLLFDLLNDFPDLPLRSLQNNKRI